MKKHMANGDYPPGYFTFHAEGASSSATDRLHWPSQYSGVTIGPGYDLKERTELEIYTDMISIGMSREDANIIKKGAGKKFREAEVFVKEFKNKIKPLNKIQKIALFTMIRRRYYLSLANVFIPNCQKKYLKKISLF